MQASTPFFRSLVVALCTSATIHASATETLVEAYVDLGSGDSVVFRTATGGAAGVQISADQGVVSHAESTSFLGGLRAISTAQGSGRAQSQSTAAWSDAFAITHPSHAAGSAGTFSAAVAVQGGLDAGFSGQAYGDSFVRAFFSIDTGVGGKRSAEGGARQTSGSDIGTTATGQESFVLFFDELPFEFGRNISTTLKLVTTAAFGTRAGSTAYASAEYGNTMTWTGLSNVRDSSGGLVTGYSALGAESGFDFASPIPEPTGTALMLAGLVALGFRLRRRQSGDAIAEVGSRGSRPHRADD